MQRSHALPKNLDEIVLFYKKYKEFFVEAMVQPLDFKKNVTKNNPAFASVNRAFAAMINDSIDQIITNEKFTPRYGEAIIYKKQNAYQHAIIGKVTGKGLINDDYEYLENFYKNVEYANFLIANANIINEAAEQWYAVHQKDMVNQNKMLLEILCNVDNDFYAVNDELNELPDLIKDQLWGKYNGTIEEADYVRFLIGAIHDEETALKEIQLTMSSTAYKEFAEESIAAEFCHRLYLDVRAKKKAKRAANRSDQHTGHIIKGGELGSSLSQDTRLDNNGSAIQSIDTLLQQQDSKRKIDVYTTKGFSIYSSATPFPLNADEEQKSNHSGNKRAKKF